jgi:hypothetical protein
VKKALNGVTWCPIICPAQQIEARYAKAKSQVDMLTQSILAKAFRGELVPRDPNDEPPRVLCLAPRTAEGYYGSNKAW